MSADNERPQSSPWPANLQPSEPEQEPTRIKAIRRLEPAEPQASTRDTPAQPMMYRQPPQSPTERVVLRLLIKGMTERQAAAELGRSHNTVHVHIRNIYRKLAVTSRKMLFMLVDANPWLLDDDTPHNAAA